MIVPQYWAEARIQQRVDERQMTVRRYGWSDDSQEAAQAHADLRVHEAFNYLAAGDDLQRRERKVPYNGADGVPIREEILSRHGSAVITRNSYGARCLNTPDVLFADVDFEREFPARGCFVFTVLLMAGVFVTGLVTRSFGKGILYALPTILAGPYLFGLILKAWIFLQGGPEKIDRRRFLRFARAHPDWRLRLYRTPLGFRVMVVHRPFDPRGDDTSDCFQALGADPVFVRMCRNQQCFRARVSPKPWRAGMDSSLRPRRAAWPVAPEYLPQRREWIAEYDRRSAAFASCRFVMETGNGPVHEAAWEVQELHDGLCQAHSELPLA